MSTTRTSGTPLIAVPGTLCAPSIFDRLAEHLADEVRIDPIDWMRAPGPWDIASIAHRVAAGISAATTVLGHSTGGAIALYLAATNPTLVSGLVIVNSGANMRNHGDVDTVLKTIDTHWGPALHTAILDRSFATPIPAADRAALLAYAATVSPQATLEVLRSQRDLDLTPLLPDITCPVTIVHGVLDKARTPAHAEELAALIPHSRLTFVRTGHSPVYEDPATVAAEIMAVR